jgi:tetratricopeptide (TPR) repeat protein
MSSHEGRRERWFLGLFVALAAIGVAWACGPDFPNQLLLDRARTLKATPVNSFAYEAEHLRTPGDELKAKETDPGADAGNKPSLDTGLPAAQLAILKQMASAADGDEAYALGKDLPEAIRLYAAAAVDYRQPCVSQGENAASPDQPTCARPHPQRLDQAEKRFSAVLALPADQRKPRAVAAAYMLGEIGLRQFADCVDCKPDDLARTVHGAFAEARASALQGSPDPQGLAVASYGEEARVFLRGDSMVNDGSADGNFCRWQGFIVGSACPATIPAHNYAKAMGLYAEQAARDSDSGVQSLRHLAGYAFGHPELLSGLIVDPLAQRVLVAYALAYSNDDSNASAADADDTNVIGHDRLAALVDAIDQHGLDHVEGADRLAALAYRSGRYDLATTLSARQSSPLSSWVQAKLALRKGDLAAAAKAYADAVRAFPAQGEATGIDRDGADLLPGEQGTLSLARGEYTQSLEQLWPHADVWWGDVAYVAERVLTVDELKHFVDTRVPASTEKMSPPDEDAASYAYTDGQVGRSTALRELLARRLMREGRYQDAFGYFREPQPEVAPKPASSVATDGGDEEPQRNRVWAQQYAKAMGRGRSAWTDIGKAEAIYQAATVARRHGMEILGYENAPDDYVVDGMYQGPFGPDKADVGPYLGQGEHDRFVASAPKPARRFHYRYVAVDEASHAADLLPPRSQAFAAVLCKASGWMQQGPPDYNDNFQNYGEPKPAAMPERMRRADALYRRYVAKGAYVAWAGDFGQQCQEPDFDRARALLRHQRITHARHLVRRYLPYEAAVLAVLVLLGAGAWFRRRNRR